MTLRIAFVGTAHWHAPIYAGILKTLGVEVVGSSDLDAEAGAATAAKLGLAFDADAGAMLDRTKPDFVFVTPRHDRVLAELAPVLARKLPLLIEKPLGVNGVQAREAARAIEAAGIWATAALPLRHNTIWHHVAALRAAGPLGTVTHAHFRLINGPPQRYRDWGVGWMLEPELSGGGALRNLGIHGADAAIRLGGAMPEVLSGATSRRSHGEKVDEFTAGLLRTPDGPIVTVEAGYSYASAGGDLEWRIAATGAYLIESATELTIRHADGRLETHATPKMPIQQPMVEAAFADFAGGRAPACPIGECAEAVMLCDRIYEAAEAS